MKVTINKKEMTLTIYTEYGDLHFRLDVTNSISLLNKINLLVKDYKYLSEISDTFEKEFYELAKDIHVKSPDEIYMFFKKYANLLIENKPFDIPSYCDSLKRTQASIFFDEEEMAKVLEMVLILKLMAPFTHDTYYTESIKPVVRYIVTKYDELNRKLFQLIKYRLKFDLHDRGALNFLKYAVTDDYLVLYNFEFVLLTAIAFYDTDANMNPVSYIVSVAADNVIYSSLSFSSQSFGYIDFIEEEGIKGDLLLEVSDSLLVNRFIDISRYLLRSMKMDIRTNLVPTPVYDNIIVPTLVLLTGVTPKVLTELSDVEKLYIQWLSVQILNRIDSAKDVLKESITLLLFGQESGSRSYGTQMSQTIFKLLYNQITYKGVDIRSVLVKGFNEMNVLNHRPMYHIINGKKSTTDVRQKLNRLLQYILFLLNDKTRYKFIEEGRKVIHDIIKHDKITEKDFKRTFKSLRV